jgi:hypothetical protein
MFMPQANAISPLPRAKLGRDRLIPLAPPAMSSAAS